MQALVPKTRNPDGLFLFPIHNLFSAASLMTPSSFPVLALKMFIRLPKKVMLLNRGRVYKVLKVMVD